MSKITITKRNRIWEKKETRRVEKDEKGATHTFIDHNVEKRDVIRPAIERFEKPCPVCPKPMFVAIGQIQHCHTECKKRYKNAKGRS